jgi:hypothetical protein
MAQRWAPSLLRSSHNETFDEPDDLEFGYERQGWRRPN